MDSRQPGDFDAWAFFDKPIGDLSPLELIVLGLLVRIEDLEEEQRFHEKQLEEVNKILSQHNLHLPDF